MSQLRPIQSSNVLKAGYDTTAQVMTVQFKDTLVYEYYEVPETLWQAFLDAQPHPWSNIGYPNLVKGGYRYKRIS